MARRLVVIDGFSLLFRAFYGSRFLSTSDGRPTNALFGFTSTLLALLAEHRPDALVVALDSPGKTFRHGDFAEYKGTRRETPPELVSQLVYSRDLIAALNFPVLESPGYEADDIVGTLARRAPGHGYETVIVTGDHDALQLVDEHTTVVVPGMRGADATVYDRDRVVQRYGFGPEHVTDYKALAGDSSDNIPGVPGIGEKSATALILAFGHVEQMLEHSAEVEAKYWKKIEPAIDSMRMSKKLATIHCDAPADYDFSPYSIDPGHLQRAVDMLLSLEFRSQAKRLEGALAPYLTEGAAAVAARVISSGIDVELDESLTSFDALAAWVGERPFGVLAGTVPGQQSMFEEAQAQTGYVAIGKDVKTGRWEDVVALFRTRPGLAVGHNVKPLYNGATHPLPPPRFDTALAAYVLQSGRSSYELDDLVQGYLDQRPVNLGQAAVSLLPLEGVMRERIAAEAQSAVYDEIEAPLVPVLAEMEDFGIVVSSDMLGDFSKSLDISIGQARTLVYELAGTEFNIGSPKQIGEVLFEKLELPGGKKTKTGWATGVEILSEMEHPVAQEILNYRELTKLKSTYADSLPKMIATDGRVHTKFNQMVAATGRLSSNEPNLQNIPVRTELGRQIRRAFLAAPGYVLASFDYSQIELRILAHMAEEQNLVAAFQRREDVHAVTASLMFHQPLEAVTPEQRRLAKLLNFAVLYGVTDFGLANQLGAGFSRSEAAELITQYDERFPAVKAFTHHMVEEARAKGFTVTMKGRRRSFPDIHNANRGMRQYAERQAMNAPIQGTAADMIKLAMLDVRKALGSSPTRMLLQVHDELVFEVPSGDEDVYGPIATKMEGALPLDVPIEVDGKSGPNWLEMTALSSASPRS